jgi:F-type H+-transporting ATPase subunit gamma
MASRREIRRRIRSIQNTAQITKAMQMVAASRMKRAQSRVQAARPYAEHMQAIVADVAGRPGAETHPLLAQRPVQNVEFVPVTPDRGLAGALVTNINRETARLVESAGHPARIVAVGRKGRGFALRMRWNMIAEFTELGDRIGMADVGPIARQILDDYESGEADVVTLVYTEFVSTLRQRPKAIQLLPVQPPGEGQVVAAPWNYEPDNPQLVLSELLPRYIEVSIFQALLESTASFYSAQMVAMSNATDNALELIEDLTLLANKARQAEITKEISEISGAAEAIRAGSTTA